jgi:hypothetical protein
MSIELKLKAENATEERVLKYLQDNASPMLANKINAGTKTLSGCLDYAKSEARKLAQGAGCVCVEDQTVFGWIVHYFEEDDVKESAPAKKAPKFRTPAPQPVKKPEPKPEPKKAAKPAKDDAQLTMIEELFK